jgi:mono/diheme cytochrome c family protein
MNNCKRIVGGLVLALAMAAQARAAAPTEVQDGKTLALHTCAACHTVSADQTQAPALQPQAPSFLSIANDPTVTQPLLIEFLQIKHQSLKTPPDMPTMLLTQREAASAAAYIMSLRKAP